MQHELDRVAIMVGPKGRGSNMAAIVEACRSGKVQASVGLVISPRADAPACRVAAELNVPTSIVEYGDDFGGRLIAALEGCRWLCLAGFLRLVPPEVIEFMEGRVLNIHPSLLPKYGGVGMYGSRVHQAIIDGGETESGCTVHFVSLEYDEGEPILQMRCPVMPDDTAETLAARVLSLEHVAYPAALQKLIVKSREAASVSNEGN